LFQRLRLDCIKIYILMKNNGQAALWMLLYVAARLDFLYTETPARESAKNSSTLWCSAATYADVIRPSTRPSSRQPHSRADSHGTATVIWLLTVATPT